MQKISAIKIFTLLILCCFINMAWAISNIENERLTLPNEGFSGLLAVGIDGKTGNQQEQNDEASAKLIWRDDNEIFLALIERKYGTKIHVKNTDNSFLHTRWTHLLDDRWALEAFAQWEKDEFDNLTSRTLEGGGGRYQVAQKKEVYSFVVGLGTFHETEKQNLVSYQETNRLWRINSYYAYKYQINEHVIFINTTYFQPGVTNWEDYRVLFDTGLNISITDRLAIDVKYKLTYDTDPAKNLAVTPPINNYKTNTEYKTSLSYNF